MVWMSVLLAFGLSPVRETTWRYVDTLNIWGVMEFQGRRTLDRYAMTLMGATTSYLLKRAPADTVIQALPAMGYTVHPDGFLLRIQTTSSGDTLILRLPSKIV